MAKNPVVDNAVPAWEPRGTILLRAGLVRAAGNSGRRGGPIPAGEPPGPSVAGMHPPNRDGCETFRETRRMWRGRRTPAMSAAPRKYGIPPGAAGTSWRPSAAGELPEAVKTPPGGRVAPAGGRIRA
jgi:hypothetical protein